MISEEIPSALAGQRIDRVVTLVANVSRSVANELIRSGDVLVDGSPPAKPSDRVSEGSIVAVEVGAPVPAVEPDPSVSFGVVFEDADVVVIDKPPHLVVHPGAGTNEPTLASGLLARYPELADVGEAERPGIVHRLDKGTSGLLMVARNMAAHASLSAQLAERTVSRHYVTVAAGLVEADSGLIDAPLGRSARQATVRAVVADGRPARTHYEVEARYRRSEATRLICRLETGRTHQIRAHLTAIGHPVLGDTAYGAPPRSSDRSHGLTRPFLHAASLGFDHPATGDRIELDSVLPPDLALVLEALGEELSDT